MNLPAAFASRVWALASQPEAARFRRALRDPGPVQHQRLHKLVRRHAGTAFGRAHDFATIRSYATFAARVPIATYDDLAPWIERIRGGEHGVLTVDRVTRLVPTSGSTGARKLIPFTAALQREYNAAISPWMLDLFRSDPALLNGRAYWSITPPAVPTDPAPSAVPIGFAEDASYLGGVRQRLVAATLAVRSTVSHTADPATFRRATLLALLRCRDLRLISVWHPSFLVLLLDDLATNWTELVAAAGVRELRGVDPRNLRRVWPDLRLVSCWADGHAAVGARDLAARVPGIRVQPKGLLATEAFVTLPCRGAHPLAVTSHFFEFLDPGGNARLANELETGETYEVVVTTGGGLWRYRLGDRVRVEGFVDRTPSLRFVGRLGVVSDRRGEKLTEEFVTKVLKELFRAGRAPVFGLLAPEEDETGCGYILYLEHSGIVASLPHELEAALRANPGYACCRDLGQLQAARVFQIHERGYETFCARAVAQGRRWGDIKPAALALDTGWSACFRGDFMATFAAADAPFRQFPGVRQS